MNIVILFFIFSICYGWVEGFNGDPFFLKRRCIRPAVMRMLGKIDLKVIEIPPVSNVQSIEQFIYQQIPEKSIIRWYLAKVIDSKSYAEVVYIKEDEQQ